ncbi:MAG: carboxypeptidase-like regulatory domain-containing protein [Gemmatimonadaceae bacterium]|jgi:hypothetical protein
MRQSVWWLGACAFVLAQRGLNAQTLRGTVRDSVTGQGVAAVAVMVSAVDGRILATGRSSAAGSFVLRLPVGGRVRIQALRMGHVPTIVDAIEVGPDEVKTLEIVLAPQAVVLPRLTADARSRCSLSSTNGQELLIVWNQARATLALSTAGWSGLDVQAMVMRLAGSSNLDRSGAQVDSTSPDVFVAQLSARGPLDSTTARASMRTADEAIEFALPAAETILSDDFASTHCFWVVRDARDTTRIGIGFRPAPKVPDRPDDIQGVLWVASDNAAARTLEFRYMHVPLGNSDVCGRGGGFQRLVCTSSRERVPGGGRINYVRLYDDMVLMHDWEIIAGLVDGPLRKVSEVDRSLCVARRPCPLMAVPQLGVYRFTTVIVQANGVEVYREYTTSDWLDQTLAKTAGKRPARMAGSIQDANGAPVANARIELPQLRRAVLTDANGRFDIPWLTPTRKVAVQILHQEFSPVAFTMDLLAGRTRNATITLERRP